MVKVVSPLPLTQDNLIDIDAWIKRLSLAEGSEKIIYDACQFASVIGEDCMTRYGMSCLAKGMETAEILAQLNFDPESIAAALVYTVSEEVDLSPEDIEEQLGKSIAQLVKNVHLLNVITLLEQNRYNQQQINTIRKMLLAMVRDVRVVVIKLAMRLCMMRNLRGQEKGFIAAVAQETGDIFAPLANRLGLYQIKWELEDLAFRYLEPKAYNEIAKTLRERRCDREARVSRIIDMLTKKLQVAGISAQVVGRAKHIYSIRRKMERKHIDLSHVYDTTAVRVLVPAVQDCYAALSVVNEHFESIPEEFDDYIAIPKPNGYQSIHTALFDEDGKTFEVQIRTVEMHDLSEKGMAAHWMYKEGKKEEGAYEQKIAWLRNLLEWQKELTHDKLLPKELEKDLFEDRVYVFTPLGDIIDLVNGATPLDFSYAIHTELGHRCRGAKVNNKIVPLTYQLKTGDRVEILSGKHNHPSRDWLLPNRGYLKTSGARAKVLQWFKQQDYAAHVMEGRALVDRELQRLAIENVNFGMVATKLQFKSQEMMFAALGRGDLRLMQVLHIIQMQFEPSLFKPRTEFIFLKKPLRKTREKGDISVSGVGQLLSHVGKCCQPIPGDPIIGYITQGKGVTIHHRDCKNVIHTDDAHQNRLVEVVWRGQTKRTYFVALEVLAYDRPNLVRDVSAVLYEDKVELDSLNAFQNRAMREIRITLTLALSNLSLLSKILDHINQIPNVHTVRRMKG